MRKMFFSLSVLLLSAAGMMAQECPTPGSGGSVKIKITSALFSVSSNKQVFFSKGNLQYNAAQDKWRFAEHQYDAIGGNGGSGNVAPYGSAASANETTDGNGRATQDAWIDLFGWGTGNAPTKWASDNSQYGTYTEWGTTAKNDLNDGTWRTLTKDEWVYLFQGRANASQKAGLATIQGAAVVGVGMVILPDNWAMPEGCTFIAKTGSGSAYADNIYTLAQWEKMEAAGAIFLPAAGYRNATLVYYAGAHGYYWSCSANEATNAYRLYFLAGNLNPQVYNNRCYGLAVRLVQDK